ITGSSNNNLLVNNTVNDNNLGGIYITGSSNNNLTRNIINNNLLYGISLNNSNTNKLIDNKISNSSSYNLYLYLANGSSIINTTIITNNSGSWMYLFKANNNLFTNTTFASDNGYVNYKGTINASGNFDVNRSQFDIQSNLVSLNSTNITFMNSNATIVFYNLRTNFTRPYVLRDGSVCSSPICINLTSLNAGNVTFNVTGWTDYTIGDYYLPAANESSDSSNSTEWRMFMRGLNHTGWDGVSYSIVRGLNRVNYTTGAQIMESSPAVANGYVYIGSTDNILYQFNASNVSQKIASYTTAGDIRSSPAVANGYVYVSSDDTKIYQLNASNVSQVAATYTTGGVVRSSPAVANGYVYVGSNDYQLYQLNASNVSQKIANYTAGNLVASSPAVANGYIYIGSGDNILYQFNASNVSQKIASYTTSGGIASSPAVANGYVYVGNNNGNLYQLNASDVSQLIGIYVTPGLTITSSPAVANGYVYIGSSDNILYQFNASNVSQKIASYTTGADVSSSPAVANGYVYVGSDDNIIYQLNASNVSQKISNYTTGNDIYSSPAVANGYVYVGSRDSILYQLNASNLELGNDVTPPTFSNYYDNNASLVNSGTGIFNVTLTNTNGTVWLQINNTNITANNITASVYNVSYAFTGNGTYTYRWYAYGNGTSNLLNNSGTRYYTVISDLTAPQVTITSPTATTYSSATVSVNIGLNEAGYCEYSLNAGTTNNTLTNTGDITFTGTTASLSNGNYILNAYCNDTSDNRNNTANVSFTVSVSVTPPDSCFPAGTKILMDDGNKKNIEDVNVGENVLSYNEETKQMQKSRVLEIESPIRESMCEINFANGKALKLTDEHPVYTSDGWKSISPEETKKENSDLIVEKLAVGDEVFSVSGSKEIKEIKCWNEIIQTYNLKKIENTNTYFAEGVLVHNKGGGGGGGDGGGDDNPPPPPCVPSQSCGSWSKCNKLGSQSRTCTDGCGSSSTESQDCVIDCTPNWQCSSWGACSGGSSSRSCSDANSCGDDSGKPVGSLDCTKKEIPKEGETGEKGGEGGTSKEGCAPNAVCGEWGECDYVDTIEDIIKGEIRKTGMKKRTCEDTTGCLGNYEDSEICRTIIEVEVIVLENTCGEETERNIVLRDAKTKAPLTNIDLNLWRSVGRLDLRFLQKESVQCNTCYNGIQDKDEIGIDCGGSCKVCRELKTNIFGESFWIFAVTLLSTFLLMLTFRLAQVRSIGKIDEHKLLFDSLLKEAYKALEVKHYERASSAYKRLKFMYHMLGDKDKVNMKTHLDKIYTHLEKDGEL
ncbi:MAG: PQQ-binding-like beta-propeller repeat protein, partial [archaeon]|nr:PQQ-binding-like beta-propeller repeat protein [archaeon]